jgi:acyl carrier protein
MNTLETTIIELAKTYSKANTIHLDSLLTADLGLDSLSLTELIVACEDEFKIEIDMDHPDTAKAKTLRDLANGIQSLISSN